jgi:Helix-turn-helix domain
MSDVTPPLLVSVKEARRLLGNISNNTIWRIIGRGELDVLGTSRKRLITLQSITAFIARQPRYQAAATDRALPPAQIAPPPRAVQP